MVSKSARFQAYRHIILDFDGVVKDTLELKADCFLTPFSGLPASFKSFATEYHFDNPGVSRVDKLTAYVAESKKYGYEISLDSALKTASEHIVDRVIKSNYMPGFLSWLSDLTTTYSIASAMPQEELDVIISALALSCPPLYAFGHPTPKYVAINAIKRSVALSSSDLLFIGDSASDYAAAQRSGVDFLIFRHARNLTSFPKSAFLPEISSFSELK